MKFILIFILGFSLSAVAQLNEKCVTNPALCTNKGTVNQEDPDSQPKSDVAQTEAECIHPNSCNTFAVGGNINDNSNITEDSKSKNNKGRQ